PRLTLFNTTGGDPVGTIILQGIGRPVRSVGLGYIGSLDQLVCLHRIPNNPANDAKFFRHDMAGNLQLMGDLAPHGMQRLGSASWLPATNELLFLGTDI